MTRRTAVITTVKAAALAGAATLGEPSRSRAQTVVKAGRAFCFCLNTATLRGQNLGIVKEVEVAAAAGYDAIEPWIESLDTYVKNGGSLADLRKRIADAGLTVESAIGFAEWAVEDAGRRAKGLERAKRDMETVAQIGGKRIAAPPAGATDLPKFELAILAERYRALLEIGRSSGVLPQLELWGFSRNLSQLGECVCVAMETGRSNACVLADVYHLYKGGSDINGIALLGPSAVQVLHMNDFPADPPRRKIDDSYRVYPGDGVGSIVEILMLLQKTGGEKVLSLELFNRKYWSADPLAVARAGLAKMKEAAGRLP
jgi:sugar phosphate isomerase/epimerase